MEAPAPARNSAARTALVVGVFGLAFAALGLALTAVLAFGMFAIDLPFYWGVMAVVNGVDIWAVIFGSLSVFPAALGLILGLVAFLPARKKGIPAKAGRWAVVIAAAALIGTGVALLVNAYLAGLLRP